MTCKFIHRLIFILGIDRCSPPARPSCHASLGTVRQPFARRPPGALQWLVVLALAVCSGLTHAQAWPSKPVRIVLPFTGGGTADLLARLVGDALSRSTGQPFVVESKPGASGSIGSLEVARAPADGYTLLLTTGSTHSIAPSKRLPYNPVDDFTPIALLTEGNLLLMASPTLHVKTVNELLTLAREKPGHLNYASSGFGTLAHLTFELLKAQAGVDIAQVNYKGMGAAYVDLISGNIHLSLDAVPGGAAHMKSNRVVGLAVTGPRRSSTIPEVPTIGETLPGFSVVVWFGLYGPRGMPAELTRRINEEVNKVLRQPDMVSRFKALGLETRLGSTAEFSEYVAADRELWSRLIRERNVKME